MELLLYSILLGVCVGSGFSSNDLVHVSNDCLEDICLDLFRDDSNTTSWNKSFTYCNSNHTKLLIPDDNTQQRISEWLQNVKDKGDVWVAGQRSQKKTWRHIDDNDTEFLEYDFNSTEAACIIGRTAADNRSGPVSYNEYGCQNKNTTITVCQVKMSEEDICKRLHTKDSFLHDGVCYIVSNESNMNWYEQQTYCMTKHNASLPYNIADKEFRANLSKTSSWWTGIHRFPWEWISASDESARTSSPIKYYRWIDGNAPVDGDEKNCIALDYNKDFRWRGENCMSSPTRSIKYFICQTDNVTATQSTTTSETTPQVSTVSDETSTGSDVSTFPLMIVIIAAAAAFAVIIVIVVVVCVIRSKTKRRKTSQREHPAADCVNSNVSVTIRPTEDSVAPYETVTLETSPVTQDFMPINTITPYSEFNGSNTPDIIPTGATSEGGQPLDANQYAVPDSQENPTRTMSEMTPPQTSWPCRIKGGQSGSDDHDDHEDEFVDNPMYSRFGEFSLKETSNKAVTFDRSKAQSAKEPVYSEVTKTRSLPIKHEAAPTGDIYALSAKDSKAADE